MEIADATIEKALTYIRNTNGGATKWNFIEDHAPVGLPIWRELERRNLIRVDEVGRIFIADTSDQ